MIALAFAGTPPSTAGEAGLRDRLVAAFARGHRVWAPAPDPYLGHEDIAGPPWTRRAQLPPLDGIAWHAECTVDTSAMWMWADAAECSTEVGARFLVDGDTIATTMGRVPEGCNETPRFVWRDRPGRLHRAAFTPAFDFNVTALWITESYLVLGLDAMYEEGGSEQRIAIWDLASGRVARTPLTEWRAKGPPRLVPPRPFDLLGSKDAIVIGERDGAIIMRRGQHVIALWPRERSWSQIASARAPAAHR